MSPVVVGMRGPDIPGLRWAHPLGQGGFADVFLYHQELPSRDMAIKVVRARGDVWDTKKLHHEADAMALLSEHPPVVELYGVETTVSKRVYPVMEYYPVANLLAQAHTRPMLLEDAPDMMIKICDVIETLHRQGYVYRGIRPLNIMMDAYGRPVLADSRVASKVGALEAGVFDGFSVLWAPPEQQDVTTPTSPLQDVWALMSMTQASVTGYSPFEDLIGDNSAASIANHVQHERMCGLRRADAPCELERVSRTVMVIDPAERTSSTKEFGEGLQRAQEEVGYPRTEMEIKEKRSKASVTVAGDQKTQPRDAPVIDPDVTWLRSATYSFEEGAGSGGVKAAAGLQKSGRSGGIDEVSARRVVEGSLEVKKIISSLAGVPLAPPAVLITVGLVAGILRGQGLFMRIAPDPEKASTSAASGDTLDVAPPKVPNLTGEYSDDTVAWAWTVPEGPVPSDIVYAYEDSGAAGKSRGRVESTSVTVGGANGENCTEITAVSCSSRRMSDPVRVCMEVP